MDQHTHPVRCRACGQVYAARVRGGEALLPTDAGRCQCGGTELADLRSDGASDHLRAVEMIVEPTT